MQLEIALAMIITVRIGRPPYIVNPKRLEKFSSSEGQSVGAGGFREDDREHIRVAAAIGEVGSRVGDHRQIEHELQPIGTAAHFEEASLPGLETTVPARLHREQMFKGDLLLSLIKIRCHAVREQAEHGWCTLRRFPFWIAN